MNPEKVLLVKKPKVIHARMTESGTYVVPGKRGELTLPEVKEEYDFLEFAIPEIKHLSIGELAEIAIKRGASTDEVAQSVNAISAITQLTDGKKPVYVLELRSGVDRDTMQYVSDMCVSANLAVLIVPEGFFGFSAVIDGGNK